MLLAVFFVSFLGSALLTRWVREVAVSHGWVSPPDSNRHLHVRPLPRLGGVAIFITLWAVVIGARWVPGGWGGWSPVSPRVALAILGPASIVFLLGLIDDLWGVSAYVKFGVQGLAAVLLYLNGFGVASISFIGRGENLGWIPGLALTILWVLWITNAFNLIDGLDGLAAGSALFSTLIICVVALLTHNDLVLFLTLVLAGSIAGLLVYNFNPATIFLGDCGSLLIGFLLSAIALAGSQKSPTVVAVAIPVVSLGFPILDLGIAVVRRFLSRRKLFTPDREHIHHKLISRGISHRQAVLLLYGVSACFGLVSLFLLNPGGQAIGMVLIIVGIGVLIGIQQLRYNEFFELGRIATRTLSQRQIIANNVSIRRAAEALDLCESLPEVCRVLRDCLDPIGFDGFSLSLNTDLHADIDIHPLTKVRKRELHLAWRNSFNDLAQWSLSFSLRTTDGNRNGFFAVYRGNADTPLLVDLDVLTTTRFASALGQCLEEISSVLALTGT